MSVLSLAEKNDLLLPVLAMALLWDSYFILSILFWLFMPERPNSAAIRKYLPAAHVVVWLLLALLWARMLFLLGAPWTTATIVVSIAVVLLGVPFIVNAGAAKRIAAGGRKRVLLLVLAGEIVLTSFCLLLIPPIGVALLISTVWLYFSLETAFLKAMQPI